jgi:hypothetical protein
MLYPLRNAHGRPVPSTQLARRNPFRNGQNYSRGHNPGGTNQDSPIVEQRTGLKNRLNQFLRNFCVEPHPRYRKVALVNGLSVSRINSAPVRFWDSSFTASTISSITPSGWGGGSLGGLQQLHHAPLAQ